MGICRPGLFATLRRNAVREAAPPELLGRVSVAMSKAAMDRLTSDIFITNLTTSFSFALVFLLLIRFLSRNMARPLDALSDSMERAQMGESQVRAKPGGPKDIAAMAHAFNSMMSVQDEREAAFAHRGNRLRDRRGHDSDRRTRSDHPGQSGVHPADRL